MLRDQAVLLLEGTPQPLKAWTARNGIYLGRLVEVTKDRPWRAVLEVTGVIKAAAHAEGGIIRRRGYRVGELIEIGGNSLMRPTHEELAHVGRSYFMTLLHELHQHQLRLIDPTCSPGRYDFSSEQVLGLTSVIEAEIDIEAALLDRRLSYADQEVPRLSVGEIAALPAWQPAGMITTRNRLQRERCRMANRLFEKYTGIVIQPTTSATGDDKDPPESEASYTRSPDGWLNHPGDVLFTRTRPGDAVNLFQVVFREASAEVSAVLLGGERTEASTLAADLIHPLLPTADLAAWQDWARHGFVETALPRVQLRLLEHLATYYGEPLTDAQVDAPGSDAQAQAEPEALAGEASYSDTPYEALSTHRHERSRAMP